MYILNKKQSINDDNISLREILQHIISENGIPLSSLAEELNINIRTFEKYLSKGVDLKFSQALSIMQFLNLKESDFIKAYKNDLNQEEGSVSEGSKNLSYIYSHFDVPTLKEIGIIKKRSKINEIESQLCNYFGFKQSIYEYDTFSLLPTLFSKSRRNIAAEKLNKMIIFWINISIYSFKTINNPYDFDRTILLEFMKRIHEYTEDVIHGYEKVVLILYRLGITVLTQSYMPKTGSFGVTMIIDNKPCIVITDMNKKYHKLWISLLHELYHVINDYDMLQSSSCHISFENNSDILFNEEKANSFALDILIPKDIQDKLSGIIPFPNRVNQLASQIGVSPSIIYGIYLENLPKEKSTIEYKKYGSSDFLYSTDLTISNVQFNPIGKQNLIEAINDIKSKLYNKIIA